MSENKLEISMAKINKDIDYIKESLGKNDQRHKEIIDKMDYWMEHAENKFAAKWTELAVKATVGVVGSALILYAFEVLVRHNL